MDSTLVNVRDVSYTPSEVSMRDGKKLPEFVLLHRWEMTFLCILLRDGIKCKNSVCPGLAPVESSHTHVFWLAIVMDLFLGCIISHWASPASLLMLLSANSESLLRHLSSFLCLWIAGWRVVQGGGRRLLPLPFPQQLQECFDVFSSSPKHPGPGLTTSQTPPPPPNKSPEHRQGLLREVLAFPACRIRVKNNFSPCTCSSKAKSEFYFYSSDFLVIVSTDR